MTKINDNGIDREMTTAEQAEYDAWAVTAQAEAVAQEEARQAAIAAKESAKAKLAALGLTEEEVNAIIGGV